MITPHKTPYASTSDLGGYHYVNVYADGRISCSCHGFSTPKRCWHIRKEAKKLGRLLQVSHFGASLGPLYSDLSVAELQAAQINAPKPVQKHIDEILKERT